jgi:type VI secretion system secreted protein Hcp
VCKGTVYPKIQIQVTLPFAEGNKTWYACELKNAVLMSYSISGSGQGETLPVEKISVRFAEIKVTYTEYDTTGRAKGNVEYRWVVDEAQGLRG